MQTFLPLARHYCLGVDFFLPTTRYSLASSSLYSIRAHPALHKRPAFEASFLVYANQLF